MIASGLEGIIAQRLVRRVCDHCREEVAAEPEVVGQLGPLFSGPQLKIFRGRGCPRCNHTGYKGRLGVYEVLLPDDRMRDMIGSSASILELQRHAEARATSSLMHDAYSKVVRGLTTPEEVLRVLGPQGEN